MGKNLKRQFLGENRTKIQYFFPNCSFFQVKNKKNNNKLFFQCKLRGLN
jgi:hypothetical protein